MATSDLNKEYLKYTKEEAKKWHFYLGGDPILRPDDNPNAFDWGTDVNFLYKIRENDINFVTDRIDWKPRLAAVPWTPNTDKDVKTLVFNPINSTAYLCVSDNANNRSDISIRGKQLSTYTPSHKNGVLTYEDGYSWYALFVVDPSKLDIVTGSKIPVMTIDDYSTEIKTTSLTQKYSQICGAGYTGTGTCCLYTKQETKDGLGVTSAKGDLTHVKLVASCYRCIELAEKLNYDYVFKSGVTTFPLYPTCTPCDCSIQIVDKITEIQKNINNLNPSGFFRHIYSNYQGFENTSEILSTFINLEKVSDKDKIISMENPKVKFKSISGNGAEAELITEYVGDNKYRINGIRLTSRGKNYKNGDAIPIIQGMEDSFLNNLIEVNVAPEDFPENPISMLNNIETCIKVSVSNKMIEETGTNLRNFTRYGIIKDVKLAADNTKASDGLNSNQYQILRATSILTLGVTMPSGPVLDEPGFGTE